MDHPWRLRPPAANFCHVCSNSHFPFCPPPPLPQYFTPPPQPPPPPHADQFLYRLLPPQPPLPPPQPSYDPFVDPYPPPPPAAQRPQQPWNGDPNYNKDLYASTGFDYHDNSQIKRMRFDNSWAIAEAATEDERRLKLIRDHGAVTHGYSQESISVKRKYGETQVGYQPWEINKNEELERTPYNNQIDNFTQNNVYGSCSGGHKSENYYDHEQTRVNREIQVYRNGLFQEQRSNFPVERQELNGHFLQPQHHIMEPKTAYYGLSNANEDVAPQKLFKYQPPLPNSPPPPLPLELPVFRLAEPVVSSSKSGPSSLFPVAADSTPSLQSPYTGVSQANASVYIHYSSKGNPKSSVNYEEDVHAIQTTSSNTHLRGSEEFLMRNLSSDKPKVIDASLILKHPHRSTRPDHIVIILRGLPGSGKSYLAKILRDLEVENGGDAPRIYSMDEYFMTEVEKVDESESLKSSASARGKKTVTKMVMEYLYEPEMEEAYRSSMLKAFKKTLDEGVFSFVIVYSEFDPFLPGIVHRIVDDRNLRVADFAQFWATAKRSGYEVYLLEATYKDPAGCAARNVHSFTLDDIQKMANQWEEAPSLYMKLDIKQSLLQGDSLEENGIQEVDMDMEDDCRIGELCGSEDTNSDAVRRPSEGDVATNGPSNDEHKWDAVEELPIEVLKELGKSKWSNDLDEDDAYKTEVTERNTSPLSGLIKANSKQGKSVRWADQVGRVGFSIGTGTTANVSLVIGPGSGYNLKSNPLPDEEKVLTHRRSGESRKQNIFQEQLRAEHESFKAVFDKRRQRIRGRLDLYKE